MPDRGNFKLIMFALNSFIIWTDESITLEPIFIENLNGIVCDRLKTFNVLATSSSRFRFSSGTNS
jgi:hypothetical protein